MIHRLATLDATKAGRIHRASMEILDTVGVVFDDETALDIFRSRGYRVDGQTVFFTEDRVMQAVDLAPSSFRLTARDPEKSVMIGGDDFVLAPGYGEAFIHDIHGNRRSSTLADYIDFCKLVQTSDPLHMNGYLLVEPTDMPPDTAHLDMLLANILYCDKPFMGSPVSAAAAGDSVEMAARVWGREALGDHPVMVSLITPFSPLKYTGEMTGAMTAFARAGQGVIIGDLIMGGATGPVSMAGMLAQQNAEVLAGLILTQLVRPGTPVIVGGSSTYVNLASGQLLTGVPETGKIASATADMARYYNLPARCGTGANNAYVPDIQAGIESALNLAAGIFSGGHFILHAAGVLGPYEAMSFEKFIIDEEICASVNKLIEPLEVNDDTLAVNVVREAGIGGNYLNDPETMAYCRRESRKPQSIMNRKNYQRWSAAGQPSLDRHAERIVKERLDAHVRPDMDPALEKDLIRFVRKRKERA